MNGKILLADPNKCTGCRSCQMACSLSHEGVCNPARSRIRVIALNHPDRYLPMGCQQCEDAPCAAACPRDAIFKDDENVRTIIDYGRCVGCKMCVYACPFGAMAFDDDRGRPFKCDLCGGDPLCVKFCEPAAITFLDGHRFHNTRAREAALLSIGMR